ncbi:hypothetical protein [Kineosporia succinea]|uniref:Uncharacterized protein n=1 Tax=Kineosporia succinea TaxID=84632 RepID=A0ABT9PB84_9ACTN|nr:hypothetical protein [Kineosporia succinea]MDP9829963.1 hypothetical protein [Kineosporia succinea]
MDPMTAGNAAEHADALTLGWGRAALKLEQGDLDTATHAALDALALSPAPDYPGLHATGLSGQKVLAHEDFPRGWSFFVPTLGVMVVNLDVYQAHVLAPSIHNHAWSVRHMPVPAWVRIDTEDWAIQDEMLRPAPESFDDDYGW